MNNMEREILELTAGQAESILYENFYNDGNQDIEFETIENEISDQGRWSTTFDLVVKRKSDGKFFSAYYSKGSTESQGHYPFEYDDCKFYEVIPMEKTITCYSWK